ncbi:MAG TPA: hypothetical protein VHM90_03140 [Phycisphaerae bacterium]|nr:hypothetical protein [Phycisphaerae bacterium]
MSGNPVIEYEQRPRSISRPALAVFVAAIVAALLFFLIVPAGLVFVAALVVRAWMARRWERGGHGLVSAAVTISGCAALAGVCFLILTPSLGCTRCLSPRSACAANLRGLAQSMNLYAADNADQYPIVPFAPYAGVSNAPSGKSSGTSDADKAMQKLFAPASPHAGDVQSSMWMLVLAGQVSPKQFVCPGDPFADKAAATATDAAGNYFDGFPNSRQLSYSMAYPWNGDGKPGAWWKNATDASLPIVADMAPRQGTGRPARNVTPAALPRDPRTWNSANHEGDGQNVAFGDGHADFVRNADAGQAGDNIYSMSASPSKGPAQFGGIATGGAAPDLRAEQPPFDVVMLPVRDATTGGM